MKTFTKACIRCEEDFTTSNSRQVICDNEHFKKCAYCGNDYPWAKRGVTCSSHCAGSLRKKNSLSIQKECAWATCSNVFEASKKSMIHCKADHFLNCENCGKKFVVKKMNAPARTCSQSCGSALTHTVEANEKRKQTSLKKYGTEYALQAEIVKKKIQESLDNSEKDMRFGSKKFKDIIQEKYGVENVSQLDEIKLKKEQSYLAKYGVPNPMQNEDVKNKLRKNNFEKYGSYTYLTSHIQHFDDWENFESWVKGLENKPTIDEVSEYFNVAYSTIVTKKNSLDLDLFFSRYSSKKEKLFIKFLQENFPEVRYSVNTRKVIAPKELDFYFPDYGFAVEISPTSTHAIDSDAFGGSDKDKNYHVDKALACESKGIELLTIFDWMDWGKTLNMISHKLQQSRKVYARKTTPVFVRKTDNAKLAKTLKDFIDESHVLGFNGRGIEYYTYLEFEDDIVAVAAWGTPRSLNVKSKNATNNVIELVRLCFKPGVSVTGGASKLLKKFVQEYSLIASLDKIVTFSDFDLGHGRVYETLGFELIDTPKAGRNFAHPFVKKSTNDDLSFRIKETSLHYAGADRLLKYFPNYTPVGTVCTCTDSYHEKAECLPSNLEIVKSYGFLEVWDCGYKKWELNIK